ncbi:hypothetical protein ATB99_04420 [Elizabethkingia meningoseptica]|uniref:DUF885 domain-containing protein n=1 Tax=Elizabethkingia meningoseptica TaxID=238 RepID=UPI000332C973|nr:DUF885 domain-containing protein [Elizabethkingia meningoseptica]AQX04462.1 hypothetical protein BBD33_04015 [Elizabethkingia meningoseptica]AQX46504.1 hypothetical protein B5G46_04010 [Elizabethkingia meningoseptica]EOR31538.1 hypothetical protein L100_00840 [Elizabethkingia meningoseptica ATCC 13253 = NBRC 12535]KUY19019.1 hypothetical protein ATB99_04420 [Elizabethkingia meningoseptica]OPB75041.1 hypothetical protein BAY30_12570 [Elizabethkingia meningoseptica]
MKNLLKIGLLATLGITVVAVSCQKKDSTKNVALDAQENDKLVKLADKYYETFLKLNPLEATSQGDLRFNDLLPDNISAKVIAEEINFYNTTTKELAGIKYDALDDQHKVIYDVLDNQLKTKVESYVYHPEYIPFTQFDGLPLTLPLLGSGKGTQPFKTERDYDNWLKRIAQFPVWMNTAEQNFRTGIKNKFVLPKKLVVKIIPQMTAAEIITPDFSKNIFYGPVKDFPKDFSAEQKQKYTKLFQEAIKDKIIPAYTKMGKFLKEEYMPHARDTDGYNALPNGKDIYAYYVKSWTTTSKTPDEIHKTGLQEVARIRSEMEKVKNQVGYKGTLEEFLVHVKTDPKAMPYKTTKEILDGFQGILTKITPKLKTMFNVTPKTPFEIRQTEKFREATASAEYMQGTPDGKRPGIFYIPIPDPKKFNVTSGMESLFLHEAIPGHHYQVSLQQENTALPKFMRFGWLGAYGEGWALYCESLGPEFGLYTDPYQKLGSLSDEMMRAVRLVVDTGLHTGQMTREDAIKYFLSNVAYDEAGATAEIERYMAIPGQALSYKTGALKIRELRSKYEKQLGAKFNLASFHDEVLSQGCLPLSVLDRKMELWAKKQQ